jgi:hypothetical protein
MNMKISNLNPVNKKKYTYPIKLYPFIQSIFLRNLSIFLLSIEFFNLFLIM